MRLLIIFLAFTSLTYAQDTQTEIVEGNIFSAERLPVEQGSQSDAAPKRAQLNSLHAMESPSQYSQAIIEVAEASGLNINSISLRKQRIVNDDDTLKVERIYFGYDANITEFTAFFQELNDRFETFQVENLNISVRRNPSRLKEFKPGKPRKALNGNCVIAFPAMDVEINRLIEQEPGFSEKDNVTPLLYTLTQTLPENSYLTSLIIKGTNKLGIQGRAENAEELRNTLEESEYFENVLASASTKHPSNNGQERFFFKMTLKQSQE